MKFHDFAPKTLYLVQFCFQDRATSFGIALTKFTQGRRDTLAKLQIKISPRVFNIFYPNLFYSETMNLLHRFRAFPTLSEVFGKTRNYTYIMLTAKFTVSQFGNICLRFPPVFSLSFQKSKFVMKIVFFNQLCFQTKFDRKIQKSKHRFPLTLRPFRMTAIII